MSSQQDYIIQLMSEKLAGIISPENERLLEELMAENPFLRQQWEAYRSRFSGEDLSRADQIAWRPLPAGKRPNRLRPLYYAAAVLALAVAVTVALWPGKRQAADAEGIRLTLADGRHVPLEGGEANLSLGGATLRRTDSGLHYTAGANASTGANRLEVPVGKDYRITLEDGTTVWLNAATTLEFPFRFSGGSRTVRVRGEAFFEVVPDDRRPFIVEGEGCTVRVLGTAFNFNNYDAKKQTLSLVSGKVQLVTAQRQVTLAPGTQVVYDGVQPAATGAFDRGSVLAWQQGLYYFEAASLREICEVLPRWYGVKVVMDNPEVGMEPFTGRLDKNRPIALFLEQLKATAALDYYIDEEKTVHFK